MNVFDRELWPGHGIFVEDWSGVQQVLRAFSRFGQCRQTSRRATEDSMLRSGNIAGPGLLAQVLDRRSAEDLQRLADAIAADAHEMLVQHGYSSHEDDLEYASGP